MVLTPTIHSFTEKLQHQTVLILLSPIPIVHHSWQVL